MLSTKQQMSATWLRRQIVVLPCLKRLSFHISDEAEALVKVARTNLSMPQKILGIGLGIVLIFVANRLLYAAFPRVDWLLNNRISFLVQFLGLISLSEWWTTRQARTFLRNSLGRSIPPEEETSLKTWLEVPTDRLQAESRELEKNPFDRIPRIVFLVLNPALQLALFLFELLLNVVLPFPKVQSHGQDWLTKTKRQRRATRQS